MADAEWEVWYRDTFDRETPPSADVSGRGLAWGLTELWARHLFEAVDGFSQFWLVRKDPPTTVEIEGDVQGARRLKAWVFGMKTALQHDYVTEADPVLLPAIVGGHLALIRAGESSARILATAAAGDDREAFQRWLLAISA